MKFLRPISKFKFFLLFLVIALIAVIYHDRKLTQTPIPDDDFETITTMAMGLLAMGFGLLLDLILLFRKSGIEAVAKALLQFIGAIALLIACWAVYVWLILPDVVPLGFTKVDSYIENSACNAATPQCGYCPGKVVNHECYFHKQDN